MKERISRIVLWASLAATSALAQAPHHLARRVEPRARAAAHSLYQPSSLNLRAPAVYRAKFVTTRGDFAIEVYRDWAPLGADRFYNLVRFGFYNGASFFRVLPGFVVQFGYSPDPRLSRVWSRAALQDDPVAKSNVLGTISFATAGANTRTTQVFINLADNTRLDSAGFSPFGRVVEGRAVVQSLYGGYGEGAPEGNGPRQDLIASQGKAYLEKNFPKLDVIKTAVVVRAAPASRPAPGHSSASAHRTTEARPAPH